MKRRIRPLTEYREHERYPTSDGGDLSRRDFLRRAAATSAVTAGTVAGVGAAGAAPAKKDNRQRITLYLGPYEQIGHSGMSARRASGSKDR